MGGREDTFNVVGKHLVQEENGGQRKRGEGGPCPKKLSTPKLKFLVATLQYVGIASIIYTVDLYVPFILAPPTSYLVIILAY